jgi:hypothetical protein
MSLVGMQMTSPKLQEEPVASSDNGSDTVVAVDEVSSSGPDTIDAAWVTMAASSTTTMLCCWFFPIAP